MNYCELEDMDLNENIYTGEGFKDVKFDNHTHYEIFHLLMDELTKQMDHYESKIDEMKYYQHVSIFYQKQIDREISEKKELQSDIYKLETIVDFLLEKLRDNQ